MEAFISRDDDKKHIYITTEKELKKENVNLSKHNKISTHKEYDVFLYKKFKNFPTDKLETTFEQMFTHKIERAYTDGERKVVEWVLTHEPTHYEGLLKLLKRGGEINNVPLTDEQVFELADTIFVGAS